MKLYYHKLGSGKPLFILHGLFGLSDNWMTVGKMLSESFTVYLVDLRNFGQSPHSDEWTYPAMANDILELMNDVLNIQQSNNKPLSLDSSPLPVLMGHSMGGKVAMQFASLYPERLEKLIVVDMAPREYPENGFDFIDKLPFIHLEGMKSRKEVEAELKKIIKDNATIQLLLKNIQWMPHPPPIAIGALSDGEGDSSQTLEWKFNLKVIVENHNKIGKTFSVRNGIQTPALFIKGERSNYIQESDILFIKKIFPHTESKTIKGAGHWVHAEQPEEFVKCVKTFIQ